MAPERINALKDQPQDDLHGYFIEDLSVGMTASFAKTATESYIVLFAGISGDINPVHLNHEFASETMFKGRIAHGMLTASFFSTVLGTKLPGPGCICIRQDLNFKAPVRVGDTVTTRGTITEIDNDRRRVKLFAECRVGDRVVLDGEATAMVPSRERQPRLWSKCISTLKSGAIPGKPVGRSIRSLFCRGDKRGCACCDTMMMCRSPRAEASRRSVTSMGFTSAIRP